MRFLNRSFAKNGLMLTLMWAFLLSALPITESVGADNSEKLKTVRQVAQRWIDVGAEQYGRGLYKASEQYLLRAQDYKEFLTESQHQQLNALLEKTKKALDERKLIFESVNKVGEIFSKHHEQYAFI